jgi:aryl-alcohol dehydrogenase-like predicted oxidoreductase
MNLNNLIISLIIMVEKEEKETKFVMPYLFLGNTGLKVSKMGYGVMTFRDHDKIDHYWKIFKKAYDFGINFFDTAEFYGENGSSEIITGKLIKKLGVSRESLVITVKVYFAPDCKKPGNVNSIGLSRKHIIEGVRNSLKRLQLDYADIVYAHRADHDTPMEETCRAFDWLIRKGYTFYWATSVWPIEKIEEAIGICRRYNLH